MKALLLLILCLIVSACGGDAREATVSSESANLILNRAHGGNGAAWGLASCESCHVLASIHQEADVVRDIVQQKGYDSCTGCHGRNGSDEPRRCVICHNSSDLASKPMLDGLHSHNFNDNTSAGLSDQNCVDCHHASDMDGVFNMNVDLTRFNDAHGLKTEYENLSGFCLRCHNRDHQQAGFPIIAQHDEPVIAIEDDYRSVDKHGDGNGSGMRTYAGLREGYQYASNVQCTDCHAMHGTKNESMLIDRSKKGLSRLDVAIREVDYQISISAGNTAQLCVMCHSMQLVLDAGDQDTGNGLSGVHEVSGDCLQCHSHGEAVQAGM